MSGFGLNAYRIFVLLLGIWTGSGIHDSLSNHFAWHADPVGWANRPPIDGIVNPWPFSTLLLLIATIVAGIVVWRYRGAGRREAVVALAGTFLILVATLAWFVPELGLMASGKLPDPDLVSHAHTWIAANAVRLVALVGLFWLALVALGRFEARRSSP